MTNKKKEKLILSHFKITHGYPVDSQETVPQIAGSKVSLLSQQWWRQSGFRHGWESHACQYHKPIQTRPRCTRSIVHLLPKIGWEIINYFIYGKYTLLIERECKEGKNSWFLQNKAHLWYIKQTLTSYFDLNIY